MNKEEKNRVTLLVEEVRELDAAATEGPWHWEPRGVGYSLWTLFAETQPHLHPLNLVNTSQEEWDANGNENRRLLARYRTLAPQLADECERLGAELEKAIARLNSVERVVETALGWAAELRGRCARGTGVDIDTQRYLESEWNRDADALERFAHGLVPATESKKEE